MGKWCKLLKNHLKLNVDVALFFNQKRTEIGIVLRDSEASLYFAASIGIPYVQDPKVIKLLALLQRI